MRHMVDEIWLFLSVSKTQSQNGKSRPHVENKSLSVLHRPQRAAMRPLALDRLNVEELGESKAAHSSGVHCYPMDINSKCQWRT